MYYNTWLVQAKFPVGCKVKINKYNFDFVGKIGEVTNYDISNEWFGVYFGDGPKFIAGKSWNEFFEHELERVYE